MQPSDRVTREELLHGAALAGDQRAWQSLYDDAYDAVYRYVHWRLAGRKSLTDEVVQETWLTAVRLIDRFDPARGGFVQWLRGIAANAVRSHLRRDNVRRRTCQSFDDNEANGAASTAAGNGQVADHRTHAAQETAAEEIAASLDALPDHYEEVLRAKYVDEQSVCDIAAIRGQTPKAIESLLTRAREAFREEYRRRANRSPP